MPRDQYHYTVALPCPDPLGYRLRAKGIDVDLVPVESWRWWVKTPERILKFWLSVPLQFISQVRWVKYLQARKSNIVHSNTNRIIRSNS